MKPIVVFQFELQPHPGQTSRECLAAVRRVVTDWVSGLFRGLGVHDLHLAFDGSCVTPRPGDKVRTEEQTCATHQLTTLEWEFLQPQEPEVVWQFSAELACDARVVEVTLVVGMSWRSFALRPLNLPLTTANPLSTVAGLRDKLLLDWNGQIAGQPIPTRARLVRKNHADTFARDVLLNPRRVLPVILFSLDGPLKIDLDSLHALQTHVLGLAEVAALLDRAAVERLVKVLGEGAVCRESVMRVYWPGLLQQGVPQAHPYQSFEQLQENLRAGPLPSMLMNLLAPASVEQLGEGRLLAAARAALARDGGAGQHTAPAAAERLAVAETELHQSRQARQQLERDSQAAQRRVLALLDELADLRAQLSALRAAPPPGTARAAEQFEELATELERAWDENKRLRADWEAARHQLAELEMDFRTYLDSSALLWEPRHLTEAAAAAGAAGGDHSFATVADALRAAAAAFADVLVVWEDAERSAEQAAFGSPAKVFQTLEAIAEVGRAYFKARSGGPPLGPMDRAFLGRVSVKYTGFESPTTLSLFGAERVFHHGGQSRQMQRHLTLGGGTTNNCLQIYFDFDTPSQRALIGYCGRHLPFASQRT